MYFIFSKQETIKNSYCVAFFSIPWNIQWASFLPWQAAHVHLNITARQNATQSTHSSHRSPSMAPNHGIIFFLFYHFLYNNIKIKYTCNLTYFFSPSQSPLNIKCSLYSFFVFFFSFMSTRRWNVVLNVWTFSHVNPN